jgi:regulator of sigma E protease
MTIALLILGLLLFVGLVVVHEWGHFIVARRNGIDVEEFGIGFPPRAWSRKMKDGWEFSLNWLPLGGFVKMKGEHDADRRPGTFGAASTSAKAKVMLAGVGMNLLTAYVLFIILALFGMPKIITPQQFNENQFTVASDTKTKVEMFVDQGSPAAKAGIKDRDIPVSIGLTPQNQQPITSADRLSELTNEFQGKKVYITLKRGGEAKTVNATLLSDKQVEASKKAGDPKGHLGVAPSEYLRNTWSSPIVAAVFEVQLTKVTLQSLGKALHGLGSTIAGVSTHNTQARQKGQTEATSQVSGPLGIFFILKQGASEGLLFIIFIIAIISLTLAIMNVLPIPALDGGRFFLIMGFRAFRRPLLKRTEELVNLIGFAVLMVLFVLITIVDVKRFF